MKKVRILIVCLLLICLCTCALAESSNGVWTYRIRDGKATLTAYEGAQIVSKIEFPSEVEGAPVTVIGDGSMLFLWLNEVGQMTELVFPETVEEIAGGFFTLGYFDEVTIPAAVKKIGDYAFNVSTILGVNFEGAPETFGEFAFSEAYLLQQVDIPEGTVSLGASCFEKCDSLQTVTLPASVTTLGKKCFSGCVSLQEVNFASGSQLTTIPMACFLSTAIEKINIPEGVTTIATNAFYNCTKLKEVYLPQTLEAISTDAFSNCTGNPTFNVVEGTYAHEWVTEKGFKAKVVPAPIVLPAGAEDGYRDLYPGCEGEDVLAARMKMYELGFFANKPTQTDYTSAMKDYVKKFEKAYGLEVDGLLSPHDQAILFYVSADE